MYALRLAQNPLRAAVAQILVVASLALASASALAQERPDAGQILQQLERQPLRLPPREDQIAPRPPEPKPALPVQPSLKVTVQRFVITGNTIFSEATLLEVVKNYLGKELDFEGLNEAANKIRAFYRERGYFLAQAYLPQQAIRGGVVEIAIIEGRLGVIELNKAPAVRLSDKLLVGILDAHLKEGQVITETGLERPLLLINDLPTASVTSEIRPSRTLGAADLRVNVDQAAGWVSGGLDYDNGGSRFIGEHRFGGTLNVNSPLGWGDQATFRGIKSTDGFDYVRAAYTIPVWYYGTRVGASVSQFDYRLGKDFAALQAHGRGEVKSVYLFHPLLRTRNANFILQGTYEDKRLFDFVDATESFERQYVDSWKLGGVGDFRDGVLSGGLNTYGLTYTSGKLSIEPPGVAVTDVTPGTGHFTAGNFYKWNGEARRLQRITDNASLLLAVQGQKASKNLTSAEKFSLGGNHGVRAYPVGEATADSGAVLTGELRYVVPGAKLFGGDFTIAGFYDAGWAKINEKPLVTDTPNRRSIEGVGLGATLGKESDFLMRASVAWRTDHETPQSDPVRRVPRVWLEAQKWF